MHLASVKKQYLVVWMLVFLVNSGQPVIHCQMTPEPLNPQLPTIYGITPTYARFTQKADLTRLSHTLMLVKNFHWIVIEDSEKKTSLVENLLRKSNLKYTHLNIKTHKSENSLASGVEQRNMALDHLRSHLSQAEDNRGVVYFMDDDNSYSQEVFDEVRSIHEDNRGVVYFMDDDNSYSLEVFDEMRKINKVGIWPVGIVGGMRVERPLVTDGKVTGFNALWKPFRPFPIDMAGFAINAILFLDHPEAKFSRKVQSGYQESVILKFFTTVAELEPLADNCTKVYVWHTRTEKPKLQNGKKLKRESILEDNDIEV